MLIVTPGSEDRAQLVKNAMESIRVRAGATAWGCAVLCCAVYAVAWDVCERACSEQTWPQRGVALCVLLLVCCGVFARAALQRAVCDRYFRAHGGARHYLRAPVR